MKICTKCNQNKKDNRFSKGCYWCKDCFKQYRIDNKKSIEDARAIYLSENQESIQEKKHEYYLENQEYFLEQQKRYNADRKEEISIYQKVYQREYKKAKKKADPAYKLRSIVSVAINIALKKNNSSKHGKSILKHLDYTMVELKVHLEKQFEPWMTWNNHGKYNAKTWNDSDSTTWTWNIDHITPHSVFQYISMNDQTFRDCWLLNNLRPLSAKQNIIEGNRR